LKEKGEGYKTRKRDEKGNKTGRKVQGGKKKIKTVQLRKGGHNKENPDRKDREKKLGVAKERQEWGREGKTEDVRRGGGKILPPGRQKKKPIRCH